MLFDDVIHKRYWKRESNTKTKKTGQQKNG